VVHGPAAVPVRDLSPPLVAAAEDDDVSVADAGAADRADVAHIRVDRVHGGTTPWPVSMQTWARRGFAIRR
jgi:hypothetical protein